MDIEEKSIEFLRLVYKNIPVDTLNKWGASRYSRFKTQVWKHLEQSGNLDEFVSNFFRFIPSGINGIVLFLSDLSVDNKKNIYDYIVINLALLVGRVQFNIKQDSETKQISEMEVKID
jgi:hypothetical protein